MEPVHVWSSGSLRRSWTGHSCRKLDWRHIWDALDPCDGAKNQQAFKRWLIKSHHRSDQNTCPDVSCQPPEAWENPGDLQISGLPGGDTPLHYCISAQHLPKIIPALFHLYVSPCHDCIRTVQHESYGLLISKPLHSPEEGHLPSREVTVGAVSCALGWWGRQNPLSVKWIT